MLANHKKTNVLRHFEAYHRAKMDSHYPNGSDLRQSYVSHLKLKLQKQRASLKAALTESECVTMASFKIAMMIAKYRKPFSEGEFVKQCFLEVASDLFKDYPNRDSIIRKINDLQLSHQTIQRRVLQLSSDIAVQIKELLQNCEYYSLALDESVDRSDIAQLCIWFRSINSEFEITSDILSVVPLKGRTRGEDIYERIFLREIKIDLILLFPI
jgi:hypothetical protein